MFGLEILDVVIGLIFVFLLLSLLATAINEYISAVMNLRGKELARGLGRLLDDFDEKHALTRAFNGVGPRLTEATDSLTERFYNHRLIRPLATRRGGFFQLFSNEPRLPSYIPARTFAMALLDVLGIDTKEANLRTALPGSTALTAGGASVTAADVEAAEKAAADAAGAARTARTAAHAAPGDAALAKAATDAEAAAKTTAADLGRVRLAKVLQILKRESPFDVKEHLQNLDTLLAQPGMPTDVRTQLVSALTGAQTQLQQLHDSVEVWFNNSMDRVSGAYKRTVQGWLFVIGLLIALCSNADTIDMWRRLSENDELREGMAARAVASIAMLDSVVYPGVTVDTTPLPAETSGGSGQTPENSTAQPGGSAQPGGASGLAAVAPPQAGTTAGSVDTNGAPRTAADSARARVHVARTRYLAARARLDSMELKLGWSRENLAAIGFLDTAKAKRQRQRDLADAQSKGDSVAAARAQNGKWWYGVNTASTRPGAFFGKLLGLFLTAIAISLGAPFWFDLLNKVISIRTAGRAPNEKPKSPEGSPKRAAEHTPM
jgi:hypothetical protein